MVTYEIRLYDSSCGISVFPVSEFITAIRIFNSVYLSNDDIYRKDIISHDWSKNLRIVLSSEEI